MGARAPAPPPGVGVDQNAALMTRMAELLESNRLVVQELRNEVSLLRTIITTQGTELTAVRSSNTELNTRIRKLEAEHRATNIIETFFLGVGSIISWPFKKAGIV